MSGMVKERSRTRDGIVRNFGWIAGTGGGVVGLILVIIVMAVVAFGPLVAPHSISETIGLPAQGPSGSAWLGTDELGRDVFSRVLHGGWSVVSVAVLATVLTYILGILIGMSAALGRPWVDMLLMRSVDVLLVFPALLLLLVLTAGAGTSSTVLVIGLVLVSTPSVARLVRIGSLEVSVTGYVEAALVRGESRLSIMLREILPNISHSVLADLGVRFSGIVALAASMNFLGLGASPPAANWGLMIAENRQLLYTNIWAVLAPAIVLAALAVAVNLLSDAYVHAHRVGGKR